MHTPPLDRGVRPTDRRSPPRGLVATLLCCAVLGCKKSPTEPPMPAQVLVSAPNPVMVVGETQQAQATVLDQFGRGMQVETSWSVSPPGIVDLSETGQVTALSPGLATLQASAGGITGSGAMTVVEPFRLEASLDTSAELDLASGLWFCEYAARVRGVAGRGGETAELTRVELVSRSVTGVLDSRVFPPEAIREPIIRTGESRTLLGIDKSSMSDRTVELTLLVGYVMGGVPGTLTALGDC